MISIFIASLVCFAYSIPQRSLNPINESLISRAKTSDDDWSMYTEGLTAYWETKFCGPFSPNHEPGDINWGWCNERNFDTQGCDEFVSVPSSVCSSCKARLADVQGDGTAGSFHQNGCSFYYIARYTCWNELTEKPSGLVGYWDQGTCGPFVQNDHNSWFCHGINYRAQDGCRDTIEVDADVCPSCSASLSVSRGTGHRESYQATVWGETCNFWWYAEYTCDPL